MTPLFIRHWSLNYILLTCYMIAWGCINAKTAKLSWKNATRQAKSRISAFLPGFHIFVFNRFLPSVDLIPLKQGGRCRPPSFFLPVTQNYHEAPIPENSCPCKPFCCGCPYEKKSRNLVLHPSQSTLKYGSENRPCLRGLIYIGDDEMMEIETVSEIERE